MIPMMLLNVTWVLGLGCMISKALAQPWKCEQQQGGNFGRKEIFFEIMFKSLVQTKDLKRPFCSRRDEALCVATRDATGV